MKIDKYQLTSDFIGMDAIKYLQILGFNKIYTDILKGKMDRKIEKELSEMKEKRDNRTTLEYAKELILAKVKEYFLMDYFYTLYGEKYFFNGGERGELFLLKEKDITSETDWISEKGEFVEVTDDYTGFWQRSGIMHMRYNKLPNLVKLARKGNEVFVLGVDLENKAYGFIRIEPNISLEYHSNFKPFGGKPAYSMAIDTSVFKALDIETYSRLKEKERLSKQKEEENIKVLREMLLV